MEKILITLLPGARAISGEQGQLLMDAMRAAGIAIDAPCGGKGTCGKCRVLVDGKEERACQYRLTSPVTVELPEAHDARILTTGSNAGIQADGTNRYALAFDIGTTTVVCFLLDGCTGAVLSHAAALNPQSAYGADVISRIEYELAHRDGALTGEIQRCLGSLTLEAAEKAGVEPGEITMAAAVGNTAMHHLLLGLDVQPLVVPPYMPSVRAAVERSADFLPIAPDARLRALPNIAGFVGADTVACMEAVEFDKLEKLTLLVDIGTNGEMVLGDRNRRLACSTAAGPAFEGAKIQFGTRAVEGAIQHSAYEEGGIVCSVIGGGRAAGICGSGLLDALHALLLAGYVDGSGKLQPDKGPPERWTVWNNQPAFDLRDGVLLTQKDVREVQLAKAAVRAGIELMAKTLGRKVSDIDTVLLAGAFGNFLRPESACAIGMLPPELLDKVRPIGNAAGEGAKRCAVSEAAYRHSQELAENTGFLELAGLPEFQDCYIDMLSLCEEE